MTTAKDHYEEAEEMLAKAKGATGPLVPVAVQVAQVHATLALVDAIRNADRRINDGLVELITKRR